jgi:hypothetical protein
MDQVIQGNLVRVADKAAVVITADVVIVEIEAAAAVKAQIKAQDLRGPLHKGNRASRVRIVLRAVLDHLSSSNNLVVVMQLKTAIARNREVIAQEAVAVVY